MPPDLAQELSRDVVLISLVLRHRGLEPVGDRGGVLHPAQALNVRRDVVGRLARRLDHALGGSLGTEQLFERAGGRPDRARVAVLQLPEHGRFGLRHAQPPQQLEGLETSSLHPRHVPVAFEEIGQAQRHPLDVVRGAADAPESHDHVEHGVGVLAASEDLAQVIHRRG